MSHLFFDFETRSRIDIKRGMDHYAPAAEPIVLAYALESGPVHSWELGQHRPERFINLVHNPETTLVAHNAAFDAAILKHAWGVNLPPERFHCTMAQAYAHSLPGSLEALGAALGLGLEKAKLADGRKLVLKFCVPNRRTYFAQPNLHHEDWVRFVEYCRQDVVAMRACFERMPRHNYQGGHKDLWNLDQRINQRGFLVDIDLAKAAVKVAEKAQKRMDRRVAEMTAGAATAATQRDKILVDLIGEHGLLMADLKASTIRKVLDEEELDEATRTLLSLRLEGSKNSAAKFKRMIETAGPDGRVRGTMQFSGADRTGRWAGRGVQPQNLFRPTISDFEYIEGVLIPAVKSGEVLDELLYGPPMEACANVLRSAIMAPEGCSLAVADWSNIEGRVLAWLAGEEWKLRAFREFDAGTGPDLYNLIYARNFSKPVEEVTKKERAVGKVMDLSGGFGGSVGAFVSMAAIYGTDLDALAETVPGTVSRDVWQTAERSYEWAVKNDKLYGLEKPVWIACRALVEVYRQSHPATVQFWHELHYACLNATKNPGVLYHVGRLKVWRSGAWLIVELPSGRRLLYANPEIRRDKEDRETLTYMNARAKQWRRIPTWHGLLVENVVQAGANDILREGLMRAEREDFEIVLHIHDEIVTEVAEDEAQECLQDLIGLMTREIEWAPGLPLAAAGYVAKRYRKE